MVVFHGTKHRFDHFYPLSHFGSYGVSHSFSVSYDGVAIHPCFINIKRPLILKDIYDHKAHSRWRHELESRNIATLVGKPTLRPPIFARLAKEMGARDIQNELLPSPDRVDPEACRLEMGIDPMFPKDQRTPENLWKA